MKWLRKLLGPPPEPAPLPERILADEDVEAHARDVVLHLVVKRKLPAKQAKQLVAAVLDALIVLPEPLDMASDAGIRALLDELDEGLRRKPKRMLKRVDVLMGKGHYRRAADLRAEAEELIAARTG